MAIGRLNFFQTCNTKGKFELWGEGFYGSIGNKANRSLANVLC